MAFSVLARRGISQKRNDSKLKPVAESLEDRMLLYATLGGQWTYGSRITYSFAPDGTSIGGVSSALFQAMANRGFSTQTWQEQFQKAAALWEQVANINLVLVSDNGAPFSTSGNQQGDSRFGDIRIAGMDLGPSALGMSYLPPPFNGGTLAGDIVMNTTAAWQINSNYDLLTVAIHEFGHALGLDHSSVQQAVMNAAYSGLKQSLTSDDIAGIQSIYNARQDDAFEPNNSFLAAASVNPYLDASGRAAIPNLDIKSSSDNDWFTVVVPSGASGTMTITMQSSNLSSLSPKVIVYNAGLGVVGSDAKPNTYGATATVTINGVSPGQRFYVRMLAANTGPTSAGAYGLLVNFNGGTQDPIAPPYTVVAEQPGQWGGSLSESTIFNPGNRKGGVSNNGNGIQVGNLFGQADILTTDVSTWRRFWGKDTPYLSNLGQRGGLDANPRGNGDTMPIVVGLDVAMNTPAAQALDGTPASNGNKDRSRLDAVDESLDGWGDDLGLLS